MKRVQPRRNEAPIFYEARPWHQREAGGLLTLLAVLAFCGTIGLIAAVVGGVK